MRDGVDVDVSVAARGGRAKTLELIAADVASRAADLVREHLGNAESVGTKSTLTDDVTATDVAVEAFIRNELQRLTPHASIIGEEGTAIKGSSDVGWVIDPIDGTVNFLYDLPVVAVSIAATVDDEVVAGAVADVVRNEVFTTRRGGGARLNGRPITTSSVTELECALVATGFSYSADRRADEARVVSRLLPATRDIRCFGSAALHLAWVACGRVDAYWESDINHWDVAAGALVAREAGAQVLLTLSEGRGSVLASPPSLWKPLLDLVSD